MRKFTTVVTAAVLALSLAGCGQSGSNTNSTTSSTESQTTQAETQQETTIQEAAPESIIITSLNGSKEKIELEVPYDPQRIAILDMASLDILDTLGVGDRVVGTASTSLEYLIEYTQKDEMVNLGTIKEADLESVMTCEPDIIFIGGRLASSYDALSEIAPVVYLSTDTELGLVESVTKNAETIASIFGLEEQVAEQTTEFESRIETLAGFAEGKTALVGMTTSGGFNLLGNDGRCSIIGKEIGFDNLTATDSTSTHGNESSFETVLKQNPDYIFVMDRDSAIGTEGAQMAKEIVENELVMQTDAYQNGNIVYLEHPAVWYTAEGGITALDVMLSDLENALFVE